MNRYGYVGNLDVAVDQADGIQVRHGAEQRLGHAARRGLREHAVLLDDFDEADVEMLGDHCLGRSFQDLQLEGGGLSGYVPTLFVSQCLQNRSLFIEANVHL